MNTEAALARLLPVVREVHQSRHTEIERIKREARAEFDRPDFLWHILLQSFATMGNSRGQIGLIKTRENYDRLQYRRLAQLDPTKRAEEVSDTCRRAGIRMPKKKAEWILACFDRIAALGGTDAAKATLLGMGSKDEKEKFLRGFAGIGPKYARNMLMDAYDEHFHDSIAIDVRINKVSAALGLNYEHSYHEHERFYQNVACQSGLNGWELDRLLYNFTDDVLARLETRQ